MIYSFACGQADGVDPHTGQAGQAGQGGQTGQAGHGTHGTHASADASTDDAASAATDVDALRDAGVPVGDRLQALQLKATAAKSSIAAATWAAIESCDRCLAANDLAAVLAARPATELLTLSDVLVAKLKQPQDARTRAAAARALLALPVEKQPAEAKVLKSECLKTTTVVGRMAWDPKEFQVSPGALVCMQMQNPDSMQHNMLLVAPGALSEIGVAAEKMGEGLQGKRRQFVPDNLKVLQVMGLIAPGSSGEMWFFAPEKIGTYPLVCTYPGHYRLMNGKLKVK